MSRAIIDVNRLRAYFFDKKVERKIKKANKLQEITKNKHVVLILAGKPKIYKKRDLRIYIKRKVFGKTTLEQLLKQAVHITTT